MYYVEFNAIQNNKKLVYFSSIWESAGERKLVEGAVEEEIDREKWCKWNMNEW